MIDYNAILDYVKRRRYWYTGSIGDDMGYKREFAWNLS